MLRFSYFFILFFRIIFAPLIFVWPVLSVIVSFFLDVVDGDFAPYAVNRKQYQLVDKTVDSWVYIFQMVYVWKYFFDLRIFLLILFVWRLIGMVIFYLTNNRKIFLIFGNHFELIFLIIFFINQFQNLKFIIENKQLFYIFLLIAFVAKLFQEWFVHVANLSIREDIFGNKRRWRSV